MFDEPQRMYSCSSSLSMILIDHGPGSPNFQVAARFLFVFRSTTHGLLETREKGLLPRQQTTLQGDNDPWLDWRPVVVLLVVPVVCHYLYSTVNWP